jgi:sulfur-carrier protein
MNIEIRFFASVRESVGTASEMVSLPSDVKTVGDVRKFLLARGGKWAEALGEGKSLRMAYNQNMTEPETKITEGCDVAFFPPVTGG